MGCEHQRRWGWGLQQTRINKPRLLQPLCHLRKGEGIPLGRVNEHVHGKDQRRRWPSPILVRHEFTYGDRATGSERGEGLAQKLTAALASFAMENVADSRHLVAGPNILFQEIACHRPEPVPDTMPPGRSEE